MATYTVTCRGKLSRGVITQLSDRGFYLYEAENLDEALDVAKRIPAVRFGGAVEVRPLDY